MGDIRVFEGGNKGATGLAESLTEKIFDTIYEEVSEGQVPLVVVLGVLRIVENQLIKDAEL